MASRREFFQSLVAGGATVRQWPERRNHRAHHTNELVYHGPMTIAANVAAIIADHPALVKTTHGHLASRYAQGGWVWKFRCQIPEHRCMVGDIRRAADGIIRVTCWSAGDPASCRHTTGYEEPAAIVARKSPPAAPILPPLSTPEPDWANDRIVTDEADYIEFTGEEPHA